MEELDIFLFSVLSSFELGSDIEKKQSCAYVDALISNIAD